MVLLHVSLTIVARSPLLCARRKYGTRPHTTQHNTTPERSFTLSDKVVLGGGRLQSRSFPCCIPPCEFLATAISINVAIVITLGVVLLRCAGSLYLDRCAAHFLLHISFDMHAGLKIIQWTKKFKNTIVLGIAFT